MKSLTNSFAVATGAVALGTRIRHMACVGLVTAGLAAIAPASEARAEPIVRDAHIADAVQTELLTDQAVDASRIDVSVAAGKVFLTGRVSDALARRRAAQLAETVRGVIAVQNDIRVVPAVTVPPAKLAENVEAALLSHPVTESYEINVEATGPGAMRLNGAVDSWVERQFAERVALDVVGVRQVENLIAVLDPQTGKRPDEEIEKDVEYAIRWNANLQGNAIETAVEDGTVILAGVVGSVAEKRLATELSRVAGVEAVDNSALEVVQDRPDGQYIDPTALSLGDIANAVRAAIVNDPRVPPENISVEMDGNIAILRGTVRRVSERRAAEKVATDTVGVRRVKNRIGVRPGVEIGDAELQESIEGTLARDPAVGARNVTVLVEDGEVNLSGTVDSFYEKARADQRAANILGVRRIDNGLAVRNRREPLGYEPYIDTTPAYLYRWYDYEPLPSWKTDRAIREDVEDQLWWSPFVDSEEITVTVDNGEVTLTGTVDSWREYDAARENAFEGGATWVRNELVVDPDGDAG